MKLKISIVIIALLMLVSGCSQSNRIQDDTADPTVPADEISNDGSTLDDPIISGSDPGYYYKHKVKDRRIADFDEVPTYSFTCIPEDTSCSSLGEGTFLLHDLAVCNYEPNDTPYNYILAIDRMNIPCHRDINKCRVYRCTENADSYDDVGIAGGDIADVSFGDSYSIDDPIGCDIIYNPYDQDPHLYSCVTNISNDTLYIYSHAFTGSNISSTSNGWPAFQSALPRMYSWFCLS